MKGLVAALAIAGACLATPAHAFIAEVTTSVAVSDAGDRAQLREALQSAVDSVLKDAIAFTPTVIVVTHARMIGDRLWIRLLLADAEGEASVESRGDEAGEPEASPPTIPPRPDATRI